MRTQKGDREAEVYITYFTTAHDWEMGSLVVHHISTATRRRAASRTYRLDELLGGSQHFVLNLLDEILDSSHGHETPHYHMPL